MFQEETSVENAEPPRDIDSAAADIFQGLDAIPWSTIKHCYRPATDVPRWLRSLRSSNSSVREAAFRELNNNLLHQGTCYAASSQAIPFLLRLAADEQTPERADIIEFLIDLAVGDPSDFQPHTLNISRQRAQEEYWRDVDIDAIPLKGESEILRQGGYTMLRHQRAEILAGMDCYNAVRAGVPTFREMLLNDKNPSVQSSSAYAVAWFPQDARPHYPDGTLFALFKFADRSDAHPYAVASAILAAAGLVKACCPPATDSTTPTEQDDTGIIRLLQTKFAEENNAFIIRWAAAKSLFDLENVDGKIILFMAKVQDHDHRLFDPKIPSFRLADLIGLSETAVSKYVRRV